MREYRKEVKRKGRPVVAASRPTEANFMSVYQYPQTTVDFINTNGNTKDLKGKPVISDMLYIDVDVQENIKPVLDLLESEGIRHFIYTTGNRGCHIHIPIERMEGTNIPYSQVEWLRDIGLLELVDSSIYREGGQIRAIGATHQKTGKLKELVETVEGAIPTIEIREQPPESRWEGMDELDVEALLEYKLNLMEERGEGGRHQHIYIIYKQGLLAGLSETQIWEDITWWNDHMTRRPHSADMIDRKLVALKRQLSV